MKTLPLLLSLALLAACASQGPQSRLGTQAKERQRIAMSRTSDCVFHSTISDFHAIDDRYVVLYSMGRRKAYLAELVGGCFDIRFQSELATVDGDRNGQICGFGRDSIAYRRTGLVDECRIIALEELSDERRLELGLGVPERKSRKDKDDKKEEKREEEKHDGSGDEAPGGGAP